MEQISRLKGAACEPGRPVFRSPCASAVVFCQSDNGRAWTRHGLGRRREKFSWHEGRNYGRGLSCNRTGTTHRRLHRSFPSCPGAAAAACGRDARQACIRLACLRWSAVMSCQPAHSDWLRWPPGWSEPRANRTLQIPDTTGAGGTSRRTRRGGRGGRWARCTPVGIGGGPAHVQLATAGVRLAGGRAPPLRFPLLPTYLCLEVRALLPATVSTCFPLCTSAAAPLLLPALPVPPPIHVAGRCFAAPSELDQPRPPVLAIIAIPKAAAAADSGIDHFLRLSRASPPFSKRRCELRAAKIFLVTAGGVCAWVCGALGVHNARRRLVRSRPFFQLLSCALAAPHPPPLSPARCPPASRRSAAP